MNMNQAGWNSLIVLLLFTTVLSFGNEMTGTNGQELINIKTQLCEINLKYSGFNVDQGKMEKEALSLLSSNISKEVQSEVYYEIARMLSNKGMESPEKVVEYCKKALESPHDVERTYRLYQLWGNALYTKGYDQRNDSIKRESLEPYLKAWLLVDQKKEFSELQKLPPLFLAHIESSPEERARYTEDLALQRKIIFQNDLIKFEGRLIDQIAEVYKPYGDEALRTDADRILNDKPSLKKLLSKVYKSWNNSKTREK